MYNHAYLKINLPQQVLFIKYQKTILFFLNLWYTIVRNLRKELISSMADVKQRMLDIVDSVPKDFWWLKTNWDGI